MCISQCGQNFVLDLKGHLLARLLDLLYDGDENQFTTEDLTAVTIQRKRLYTHKTMRVNYTTYDTQRDQDVVNTRTHLTSWYSHTKMRTKHRRTPTGTDECWESSTPMFAMLAPEQKPRESPSRWNSCGFGGSDAT